MVEHRQDLGSVVGIAEIRIEGRFSETIALDRDHPEAKLFAERAVELCQLEGSEACPLAAKEHHGPSLRIAFIDIDDLAALVVELVDLGADMIETVPYLERFRLGNGWLRLRKRGKACSRGKRTGQKRRGQL